VSKVGVKVGMVGSGVTGCGVVVGSTARSRGVLVGKGEEVELGMVFDSVAEIRAVGILLVGACPQAVRNKIPPSRLIKICFNVFLPIMVRCFLFALFYHLNERSQVRVPIFLLSSCLAYYRWSRYDGPLRRPPTRPARMTIPSSPSSQSESASPKIRTQRGSDSQDNANN